MRKTRVYQDRLPRRHPVAPAGRDHGMIRAEAAPNPIVGLQRTIGNRALQRGLSDGTLPPWLALGQQQALGNQAVQRLLRGHVLQPKLTVTSPDDQYEHEADQVTDTVMGMPEPQPAHEAAGAGAGAHALQRSEQESKEPGDTPPVTPHLEAGIGALQGRGQPLPESERAFFEPRFGADFSGVRVHADGQAAVLARVVDAQAFTVGQDIAFGAGHYAPGTTEGRRLLAHELTHTIQQGGVQRRAMSEGVIARKAPADPTAPKTLHMGASGPAVEEVQQHLNRHGASPALKVDGIFGSKTHAAVIAFQQHHKDPENKPLAPDGIIGPKTWRALQQSAATPTPPGATMHPREEVQQLLAKGEAMTPAEALKAKQLLFTLKGDEFRGVLKEAIASGAFLQMLQKLNLAEVLNVLSHIRQEVVIPTTLLRPATNTIKDDFKRANEIYNPHGVEIEQGNHIELSEKATRTLLGRNQSLDEFTTDKATAEELKLLEMNRMKGRIAGYWVPDMTSSRGETLLKDHLKNMGDDRTAVVVNAGGRAQDTFAHEVGHALGLDHEDTDPNNLMASGNVRNITGAGIDKLTDTQLAIIRNSVFTELGKKGVGE